MDRWPCENSLNSFRHTKVEAFGPLKYEKIDANAFGLSSGTAWNPDGTRVPHLRFRITRYYEQVLQGLPWPHQIPSCYGFRLTRSFSTILEIFLFQNRKEHLISFLSQWRNRKGKFLRYRYRVYRVKFNKLLIDRNINISRNNIIFVNRNNIMLFFLNHRSGEINSFLIFRFFFLFFFGLQSTPVISIALMTRRKYFL